MLFAIKPSLGPLLFEPIHRAVFNIFNEVKLIELRREIASRHCIIFSSYSKLKDQCDHISNISLKTPTNFS